MKRFAKIILVLIAAVAALLLLVLIGINLYLQSSDVQQRIRLATERALGMPVTVKRTLFTPWNGLTLSGLSLPDPSIPGATLVDAPKFSVQFEFFPLLGHRFIITSVSLEDPHLSLRQNDDRKWVLIPPRRPAEVAPSGEAPTPTTAPETLPTGPRPPVFTVELQQFHVSGGRADIIDRKGVVLAHIEGIIIDGRIDPDHHIEGDLWIDTISIAGQLYPNRLRAHFVQEGEHLAITNVKSALAGGKVRAEIHAAAPRGGTPEFQLRMEVEEVSVPTLISEAGGDSTGTSGTLLGHAELRGNPLRVDSLVGQGEFSLDSAQLRPLDFIQQIGLILRIDELQMLNLQVATLRFAINDQKFWINDLTFKTENVIITGKGPIRFDGKLNLEGRLMLNEKIQHQLGGLLGDNFTPSEDAGYKQVGFSVNGRVDHPKTDLVEKITGIELGNVGGILKGLFRMPKPRATDDSAPSDQPPAGN